MENPKPNEQLKFYADSPDGNVNKYLVYPMYDLEHSFSTLGKFIQKGWRIKAAYHVYNDKRSMKIPLNMIDPEAPHHFHMRREMENNWLELEKLQGKQDK